MSERDEAIALANRVLDRPSGDPDDDLAVLARQFLRALEPRDEHGRPHCASCSCGKRAPVQGERFGNGRRIGPGTIAWREHLEAFGAYSGKYGSDQSADRIAERGGFSYGELQTFLGRDPVTWIPR